MDKDSSDSRVVNAIRELTFAVWAVAGVTLIQIGFSAVAWIAPEVYMKRFAHVTESAVSESASSAGPSAPPMASVESLDGLLPEQMIERASAILLTRYQPDNANLKSVVSEILKKRPETTLYYSIGDEFPSLSHAAPKQNVEYGEGNIVFMTGSPASMASAYTVMDGRVPGLGDMPITMIRQILGTGGK